MAISALFKLSTSPDFCDLLGAVSAWSCSTLPPQESFMDREVSELSSAPSTTGPCPKPLHTLFDSSDILPWEAGRFTVVRSMEERSTGKSHVCQMKDGLSGHMVTVKHVKAELQSQASKVWVDIGCMAYLNRMAFPYTCSLQGVYSDRDALKVVTDFAAEGDLFEWAKVCQEQPGPAREAVVLPLAKQVMDAVRLLHDLSIVHGDISPESILLSQSPSDGALQVQLADFGRSSVGRCAYGAAGKPAYQAPELHSGDACDGFLADAFSVGVVLYSLSLFELPWSSTQSRKCKVFEYFREQGFRALVSRRKCYKRQMRVVDCLSENLLTLLEGLLTVEPTERLCLGEEVCFEGEERRCVWQEAWLQGSRAPFVPVDGVVRCRSQ